MKAGTWAFVAPAYLLLCLIAGGSSQGAWANLLLQLIAIAMLVVAAWNPLRRSSKPSFGGLAALGIALAGLALLQLVPLPPGLWAQLPGRGFAAAGFDLLGVSRPWASWSIAPSETIAALLPLLVPAGMLAAIAQGGADRPRLLVAAVVAGTLAGILLGFLQVRGGGEHWYLYPISSLGRMAGFFANSNHMGTLILVSVPFVAALAADQLRGRPDLSQRGLVAGVSAGLAVVLTIAVLLNRSTALLLLGGPVILASLSIPAWRRPGMQKWLAASAALALAGAVLVGVAEGRMDRTGEDSSIQTRVEIWTVSARAIEDMRLTGSGLGTFSRAYRHYEDPKQVDATWVNHAHNDYLEVALELGLPGLVLVALFLAWWARRSTAAWRSGDGYARAGVVGSATILLHSLVDFPLRTAAIAALFAACIGLLVSRRAAAQAASPDDLWPSRHLADD